MNRQILDQPSQRFVPFFSRPLLCRGQILSELEKCIIQYRDQFEESLPLPVEAKVNRAIDAGSADVIFV